MSAAEAWENMPEWLDDDVEYDAEQETGSTGDEPSDAETDPFTDLANSERLVSRFGDDLRHVAKWKAWLVYDGRRWKRVDGTGLVVRRAAHVVREMFAEARRGALNATRALTAATEKHGVGSEQEDRAKAALKRALAFVAWAKTSQSKQRIEAMIALAASADLIAIEHDELDCKPYLINVANGTIDLSRGLSKAELRAHRREDLLTKITLVAYDEGATAPIWEAFLQVIVPDTDVRTLLQRYAGCCLTGDVSDRVFLFLYGTGRNGKSVFLKVLRTLLGEYGIVAAPDLLLKKKGEPHPTEIADLAGARLVVCQEVPKNRTFDEQRIKELTGNEGSIKGRRMHEDFWQFRPELKIAITGNAQPRVHDDTDAIWDRMRLAPFTTRITDEQEDKQLGDKLMAELSGVLAWAVRGWADWKKHGLPAPQAVAEATRAYRSGEDVIGRFLSDCCVLHKDRVATAKQVTDAAREWCEANGDSQISKKDLGDRLRREGCVERRTNKARGWRGVGLLTPAEISAQTAEETSRAEAVDSIAGSFTPAAPVTFGDATLPLLSDRPGNDSRERKGADSRHQASRVTEDPQPYDDGEPFYEGAFDDLGLSGGAE